MASSMEDYGSELQDLQRSSGRGSQYLHGSSSYLRGSTNFLRGSTSGYYEADDPGEPPSTGGVGSSRHLSASQQGYHPPASTQHHSRGYYSPPGTSYTIVERPPSSSYHHSTPFRHHTTRGHTPEPRGGRGPISPEQVLK